MEGAHAGHAGVEREQQVETLLGSHLTDQDPARPHPQALLHEIAQPDLAGALQPALPGLHGDPVGVREPQHKAITTTDREDLTRPRTPLTDRLAELTNTAPTTANIPLRPCEPWCTKGDGNPTTTQGAATPTASWASPPGYPFTC